MKRFRITRCLAIGLVAGLACNGRDQRPSVADAAADAAPPPQRIVSVAPSATEILFAIGAGDRVVGRTEWCVQPPAARQAATIGGYATPNLEAVLALQPDCVVYVPSIVRDAPAFAQALEAAGAQRVAVEMGGIDSAIATITQIGEAVGSRQRAAAVVQQLRGELAALRASAGPDARPRVLVTLSHEPHALFVAGRGTFIDELLAYAGATNALEVEGYFAITAEALLGAAPDVIVDAAGPMEDREAAARDSAALWGRFPDLPAVKHGRVRLVPDASLIVPGPRMPEAARVLRRLIHEDGK